MTCTVALQSHMHPADTCRSLLGDVSRASVTVCYVMQLGARHTEAAAAVLELQRLAADMNATVQARRSGPPSLMPSCGVELHAVAHVEATQPKAEPSKSLLILAFLAVQW